MPIKKGWLLVIFFATSALLFCVQISMTQPNSSIRISSSKNLFKGHELLSNSYQKLKAGLEVVLSSDFGEIPAGRAIEIQAALNPGLDYQNVTLEWRLGSGVRLIDGSITEVIPFLNRGVFAIKKIHVVFLDQDKNHQIHVVARFKENGKALGAVAQFNSRPDLIEASKLQIAPPPIPKNLFENTPVEAPPHKPRIVM